MTKLNIIAIAAITLDGKIAAHSSHLSDWTSPEDKELLRKLLDGSDVIVVGNNTYKTAQKPLSKRNCIVITHSVAATEQKNDRLLLCNPKNINLAALLNKYLTVAVLGGSQIYTYFFDRDWLDEIYLTIEPLAFGQGLGLFSSIASKQIKFKLLKMKRLNQAGSILLHYRRISQPKPKNRLKQL